MLTKGDDYPLHQTPEPMAVSGGNRNFYDRYFFNGYSADGDIFFAAALGVYPQLDIMDAAFCVSIGGWQHNLRASKRMSSERLELEVGPIKIEIVKPLKTIRLIVSEDKESGCPITADIAFTARHDPIEEPRFTRREGPRLDDGLYAYDAKWRVVRNDQYGGPGYPAVAGCPFRYQRP